MLCLPVGIFPEIDSLVCLAGNSEYRADMYHYRTRHRRHCHHHVASAQTRNWNTVDDPSHGRVLDRYYFRCNPS